MCDEEELELASPTVAIDYNYFMFPDDKKMFHLSRGILTYKRPFRNAVALMEEEPIWVRISKCVPIDKYHVFVI